MSAMSHVQYYSQLTSLGTLLGKEIETDEGNIFFETRKVCPHLSPEQIDQLFEKVNKEGSVPVAAPSILVAESYHQLELSKMPKWKLRHSQVVVTPRNEKNGLDPKYFDPAKILFVKEAKEFARQHWAQKLTFIDWEMVVHFTTSRDDLDIYCAGNRDWKTKTLQLKSFSADPLRNLELTGTACGASVIPKCSDCAQSVFSSLCCSKKPGEGVENESDIALPARVIATFKAQGYFPKAPK